MIRGYDPDRLRAGLRAVLLEGVFRVIHRSHSDAPLAATPAPSRFSDPQMRYAVLYAASSVRCAFWETLGRNRFARRQRRRLPRSEVEARLVVSVRSEDTLPLSMKACPKRTGFCLRLDSRVTCAWPCLTGPSLGCRPSTQQNSFSTPNSSMPSTNTTSC